MPLTAKFTLQKKALSEVWSVQVVTQRIQRQNWGFNIKKKVEGKHTNG